ncbi:unnamed protein product [Peronospora destructor]|uniref:Uncharacterized protein n=1 Tax=Peronospora destructor TaxID=86335 RepID=A0AAV0V7T3_9STRA|nr:unnamed protein product [Peronospora destructor]
MLSPAGLYKNARSTKFLVEDLVGYMWQMTDQFATLIRVNFFFVDEAATNKVFDRLPMASFRCAKSIR